MAEGKRGIGTRFLDGFTRAVAYGVATVSPAAAKRYVHGMQSFRYYAAAALTGPRKNWRPPNKTADEMLRRDHKMLRARARDLVRDSSHVSGAIGKLANNVIFRGLEPRARLKTNEGELQTRRNKRADKIWRDWAKRVGFAELQRLVFNHQWMDGEILIHYYFEPDYLREGIAPLGVELLECDHLDEWVDGQLDNGNIAKRGIEYTPHGKVVAYHLHNQHPGDTGILAVTETRRIPAERIDHVYRPVRASQHRGEPWLTSVIPDIKDLSEYRDSERIAARLSSAFGIFVTTPYPEHQVPGQNPIINNGSQNKSPEDIPEFLDPGRIDVLPPGMDVKTAKQERPGTTYEPFVKDTLKGISAGVGMSYSAFSHDYTDSSYASERSASLEERRGYRVMQEFIGSRFIEPAWDRVHAMSRMAGLESLPAEIPMELTTPGWPWVDPDKDSKAAERDLKNSLTTRRKLCADRGLDFDEVVDELKREQEQLAEAGVVDPLAVEAARSARPLPEPQSGEDEDEFIDRCMQSKAMKSEFPKSKQRLAVCERIWEEAQEEEEDDA